MALFVLIDKESNAPMSRYWSPLVRQLTPYTPGEQPRIDGLIKLNTNESPYPPSPRVRACLDSEAVERLRLYPDPNSSALKEQIADYYGLCPGQVFVGNGSDEVLAFAFMAFFKQSLPLLFPDISYSFYPVYCRLLGIEAQPLELTQDLQIELDDYRRPNGGIVFANPNAPTGRALPLEAIKRLLDENTESVVLIDEAYVDFGAESAAALVDCYPNLIVTQTLSKSRSLAGLRLGFALAPAELIEALDRVKNSFNSYPVDRLAEAAGCAAMADRDYFEQCRERVIASREWTREQLSRRGFEVLPSSANFLFTRVPAHWTARDLAQALRQERILVRHFERPRIADYLRISIGSETDMQTLIASLDKVL